jgi:hypothetical protein
VAEPDRRAGGRINGGIRGSALNTNQPTSRPARKGNKPMSGANRSFYGP